MRTGPSSAWHRRVATVDVGTNTILLLVADVERGGRLVPVFDEERFVRLGEGVDASGALSEAAMDRVLTALHDYARLARAHGADIVSVAGTSASRDAANVGALADRVRAEVGVDYEVISGAEEALWSFRGAVSAFGELREATVLDVGGGSTEIVSGPVAAEDVQRASIDIGAVRLTERHFAQLPPLPGMIAAARGQVDQELARLALREDLPLVGAAGTVTALARLAQPETPWSPLAADVVRDWCDRLLGMDAAAVRALDPELLSGRADVFAAGVLIVDAVMRRLCAPELLPSPRGLRHGLALRWLEGSG